MATLASVVHLVDDEGMNHVFSPDDEVPAWAASMITNPKAWAVAPQVETATEPAPAPTARKATAPRPARRKAAPDATVQPG